MDTDRQNRSPLGRALLLLLVLSLALVGCQPAPAQVEPEGVNVGLNDSDINLNFPESLQEPLGWQYKGDFYFAVGQVEEALFCYHQAQELFPKEAPQFAEGSEWGQRKWTGHPMRTYLSKCSVYVRLKELELADHYLALSQQYKEHPSDESKIREVQGRLLYVRGQFAEVKALLEGERALVSRFVYAVARVKLKEDGAEEELFYLWKEMLYGGEAGLAIMEHYLPGDVWAIAEQAYERRRSTL